MQDLERRLSALEALVSHLIRPGIVTGRNPDAHTVRVRFPDADGLVTREFPVLAGKTLKDKAYWLPDVGEHVLCLCLPTGLEQGFAIGAFYSGADPVPLSDLDKRHVLFEDGSWFTYDRREHRLSGHVKAGYADLTVDLDATLDVGRDLAATVGRDATVAVTRDARITAGRDLVASAGEDLAADAGKTASITAGEKLTGSAPKVELQGGAEILLVAPLITQLGNLATGGAGGGSGTEIKTCDTTQTGSFHLVGHLTVDTLTVRDPINGTMAGGA